MTFEMWVKLEAAVPTSSNYGLIHKGDGAGSGAASTSYAWRLRETGGGNELNFAYSNNGSDFTEVSQTVNIPTAVWTHLAVSVTASTKAIKYYVNGREYSLSGTGTPTSIQDSSSAFYIGNDTLGATRYFDGLIKDARVFNDIRSQAEIVADAHTEVVSDANLVAQWNFNNAYTSTTGNNTLSGSGSPTFATDRPWVGSAQISGATYIETNLVAYYTFNEASGTRLDSTANNNDLTDNNTVLSGTGKKGDAADFEAGNSEYLTITDAAQTGLDAGNNISLALWAKFESLPSGGGTMVFADKLVSTVSGYRFQVSEVSGSYRLRGYYAKTGGADDSYFRTNPDVALSTATWYFIVFTIEAAATTGRIYINGIEVAVQNDGTLSNAITDGTATFTVGSLVAGGSYFDGLLDEMAFYGRLLHYGDVLDLYNGATGVTFINSTAYTKDLTETIALVDSAKRDTGKRLVDAFALVDVVKRGGGKLVTDVITLVDTVDVIQIFTQALTETITLVDTARRDTAKILTEAITLVDSARRAMTRNLVDTITLVDSAAINTFYSKALTEAIAIGDSIQKATGKFLADTITLVDTVATRFTAILLTDVFTLVDSKSLIHGYVKSFTETISLNDTLSQVRAYSRMFSDRISLATRVFLNGVNAAWVDKYVRKATTWIGKYTDPK